MWFNRSPIPGTVWVAAVLTAGGCSSVGGIADGANRTDGIDAAFDNLLVDSGTDVPAGMDADIPTPGCDGDAPWCASSCGSDALVGEAECSDGKWVCKEGVLFDDCPPGTCWGGPTPGEICGPAGWECHPDQTGAYEWCPDFMCPECTGFDGPVTVDGCHCWCDGSYVLCEKAVVCETGTESNLDGVSIHFSAKKCSWTLAEAASGIEVPWNIVVEVDHKKVFPQPQDAGWCGQPGTSGLIVFEKLIGGDQTYCICDQGLCMGPDDQPVILKKGEYPGSFEWDGVNWTGPSDTGNPKGDPFPPGTYTLTVSAVGALGKRSGNPFEVKGTLEIQLLAE